MRAYQQSTIRRFENSESQLAQTCHGHDSTLIRRSDPRGETHVCITTYVVRRLCAKERYYRRCTCRFRGCPPSFFLKPFGRTVSERRVDQFIWVVTGCRGPHLLFSPRCSPPESSSKFAGATRLEPAPLLRDRQVRSLSARILDGEIACSQRRLDFLLTNDLFRS